MCGCASQVKIPMDHNLLEAAHNNLTHVRPHTMAKTKIMMVTSDGKKTKMVRGNQLLKNGKEKRVIVAALNNGSQIKAVVKEITKVQKFII